MGRCAVSLSPSRDACYDPCCHPYALAFGLATPRLTNHPRSEGWREGIGGHSPLPNAKKSERRRSASHASRRADVDFATAADAFSR